MAEIVIVGGGVGGLVAAKRLRRSLMLLEARLRAHGVRGRSDVAVYTPSRSRSRSRSRSSQAAARSTSRRAMSRSMTLVYVPPHAAPAFVVDAGLAPVGEWVKVDPKTLATSFERVWAVGDVTGIPLPNGKSLPKAGVFAEGQSGPGSRGGFR